MISFLFRETFDEYSEPLQYKTRQSDHSNMLSSSEASLSPKAKVSYDDGEFAVEIPLRDYKVSYKLFAGNQGNHQNFEKSLLSYKCWLIFIGMKQKKGSALQVFDAHFIFKKVAQ